MRELAQTESKTPEVSSLAAYCGNPVNLDVFLRQFWRFVFDPPDVEYVRSPLFQCNAFQKSNRLVGDCDDAAVLAASILHSLDWPCSFVAYRFKGNDEFSHVNVRAPLLDLVEEPIIFDVDPTVPENHLPISNAVELLEVAV